MAENMIKILFLSECIARHTVRLGEAGIWYIFNYGAYSFSKCLIFSFLFDSGI